MIGVFVVQDYVLMSGRPLGTTLFKAVPAIGADDVEATHAIPSQREHVVGATHASPLPSHGTRATYTSIPSKSTQKGKMTR